MPDYVTPYGPFETPDDVHQAAAPLRNAIRRGAGAASGPEFRRLWTDAAAHHIISTLTSCGVQLGAEDERTARWAAATLDQPQIAVFLDWAKRAHQAATLPAMTWVLYRAENGCDILSPAGIEGRQDTPVGPVDLAVAKLTETTSAHPSWAVKVFGPDDRLLAWAQWEDGEAAGYPAEAEPVESAELVHALPNIDCPGRCAGVVPGPRCGARGQTALFAADVTCPGCIALMDAEDRS